MRVLTPTIPVLAFAMLGAAVPRAALAQVATTSTTSTTAPPASTTTTTLPPELRCKNRLLNRAIKLDRRLARCAVAARKRAKRGKPFDQGACIAAALERYDRRTVGSSAFGVSCLTCTRDAIGPVRDGLAALSAAVDGLLACAPAVPIAERARCEIKLRKAVASYQAALMRCRKQAAALAFGGGAPDELQCVLDAGLRFDARAARLTCPACVDPGRIRATVFEDTDDAIGLAHCPCRFGGADACGECQTCSVSEGCIPANEGEPCGRNGCTEETCVAGACTVGDRVACSDGDVCTVDVCIDDEDETCQGAACCVHEPLCDPATLGACVLECTCDPAQGCSCQCQAGCDYPGCVVFVGPAATP